MSNIWIKGSGWKVRRSHPKEPGAEEYVPAKDYNELLEWASDAVGREALARALAAQLARATQLDAADAMPLDDVASYTAAVKAQQIRRTVQEINDTLKLGMNLDG